MRRLAGVLLVSVLGLAAGCGDDGDDDASPTTSTATTASSSTTTAPDETTTTTSPPATATTAVADEAGEATDLADGRHPALVTGIDVEGRTIEVDVIQFLTGEEATTAYQEDYPDDPGGPPNDYYIVNDNPRVRTLAVAEDVDVQLVRMEETESAELEPGTWEELPDYFAGYAADDGTLWYSPFWLTIEGGAVVAIEEQYLP